MILVKKSSIKKIVILLSTMLLLFIAVNSESIGAYFTDADTKINRITIGSVETEIEEVFEPEKPDPGDRIKKEISVINTGKSDCYVRVKAVFSDSDMEKKCIVDWNTTDWVYDTIDGYYYYKTVLASGKKTKNLCTAITILSTATNIKEFDVIVYAESYQAEGFESYREAWDYYERNK